MDPCETCPMWASCEGEGTACPARTKADAPWPEDPYK